MPQLKGMAKAIYSTGRFVSVGPAGAVFALDNAPTVERAERFRSDVEGALSQHFATAVTLVLVDGTDPNALAEAAAPTVPAAAPAVTQSVDEAAVESAATDGTPTDGTPTDDTADDDESAIIDVHELEDADVAASGMDKLTRAFPGAVLVDGPDGA